MKKRFVFTAALMAAISAANAQAPGSAARYPALW